MGYVIGVDIGTSSTKAVVFDTEGQQVKRSAQAYPLQVPEPGAAELDAGTILSAVNATVTRVSHGLDRSQLLGVAFSAAMHMLMLVDAKGQPLTPVYTWADSRSDRAIGTVQAADADLYQRTGIPIHPMSPLVKLVWLKQAQPDVFAQAQRIVSIKEYVLYHWCGEWVVDIAVAGATGLWNLRSRDWDPQALSLASLERPQLSTLVSTDYTLPFKPPQPTVANACGIATGTPVIVGATDGVLANLGVGAIATETAAITLGTSGAIRRGVSGPIVEPASQLFCYALSESQWIMGGAVNAGGVALQWVKDSLFGGASQREQGSGKLTFEHLTGMAAAIAPGADGLIFHPYLLGERAPLWNPHARASFVGLGIHHNQGHIVRAVMEGVLYNLHTVFQALENAGGTITHLRASGGFVRSPLWQQMLADIFDRPITVPTVVESSAFGAAVLALVSLGQWHSLEEVIERDNIATIQEPIATHVKQYRKLLPLYQELLVGFQQQYGTLQQMMHD